MSGEEGESPGEMCEEDGDNCDAELFVIRVISKGEGDDDEGMDDFKEVEAVVVGGGDDEGDGESEGEDTGDGEGIGSSILPRLPTEEIRKGKRIVDNDKYDSTSVAK